MFLFLRRGFWAAAIVSMMIAPLLQAQTALSARDLAARIDHHYNSLHSLSVHFVQHYDGMGAHRKEEGVLLLRKPGRMRWSYTDPDGQLFILDGKYAYFYTPGQSEAQRVPEKQLNDLRSPLRFLLGHTELEKEMADLRATRAGNGDYELSGVPKGMEQRVSELKIEAAPDGTIRTMSIVETDGVTNSFDLSGELGNAPAPDGAFVFTAPPGVHIVDGQPPV
ncbi:MAG: outer membrane lipoprotein chaperone LolA [Acidobacteriaceae bacterium]